MGRNKMDKHPIPEDELSAFLASISSDPDRYAWRFKFNRPGTFLWSFAGGKVGFSDIERDDLLRHCDQELAPEVAGDGEIVNWKAILVDAGGKCVRDTKQQPVVLVLRENQTVGKKTASGKAKTAEIETDPLLAQQEKDLRTKRQEIALRRAAAQLARDEKRIERLEAGEDDDLDGPDPRWPLGKGVPFRVDEHGIVHPVERKPEGAGMMEMFMAMQQQQTSLLVAMMNRPQDNTFKDLLPVMLSQQMRPGEVITMLADAQRSGTTGMKALMESQLELWGGMMARTIERMQEDGRPEDEIDKAVRWKDLITDGLSTVIQKSLGRDHLLNLQPPGAGKVPMPQKDGQAKKLPPPSKSPEEVKLQAQKRAAEGDAGTAAPGAPSAAVPPAPAVPPGLAAARERVGALCQIALHEMNSMSDPTYVAQRLFKDTPDADALYPQLPRPVRERIELVGTPEDAAAKPLFDVVSDWAREENVELQKASTESADRGAWIVEFWSTLAETAREQKGPPPEIDAPPPVKEPRPKKAKASDGG